MLEPLLLTCVHVTTWRERSLLTNASGFFFARDERLYLVTSGHVLEDAASGHHPDQITINIHNDPANLATSVALFLPLFDNGDKAWRQGTDRAGAVDVAVLEIPRDKLPGSAVFYAFTPANLHDAIERIEIGSKLLIVGFPLGFHDTLHHLPVARQAINASSFGLRFQGKGYFLTDARTHRGTSGAPVVMRNGGDSGLPWLLLGIHSARLDVGTRDMEMDEALGLNCAWFADILMPLTAG